MTEASTTHPVPSARVLLSLAWPIVLARATQAVIGFCDALLVAPLGEEALAAVTTGALDVFSFVMLPMGTVFILQSFASQLRGRGDVEALRRYALYGLLLALLAGAFAAACIPLIAHVLRWLDYAPGVQREMNSYICIRLLSVTAAVGLEALGNWYGGLGNTRIAMIAGVVAMLLNVLVCYLLIEPRFGLPGYGVSGAAWASVISSWAGFLLVLLLFVRGVGHGLPRSALRLRWHEMTRVLRFGLPNGVNWFLEFAAFALFINVVVGHLGTTVLAAFNVVFQINTISFMPAFGAASAGAILVGEAIGRGLHEHVRPIVRMTLFVTVGWMVSVGVIYLLLPAPLIGLFQPRGVPADELLRIGATMLALCGVWQAFDAMGITYGEALRAAGDTAWPMRARIALAWLGFTPLAWAAVYTFHGGVITIMVSLIIYIATLSLVLAYRFASNRWQSINLVGETLDPVAE